MLRDFWQKLRSTLTNPQNLALPQILRKSNKLHLKIGERNRIEDNDGVFKAVKDFAIFDGFSCVDEDLDEFILQDAKEHQNELLCITYAYFLNQNPDAPIVFASLSNSAIKLKTKHPARENITDVPYKDFPAVKIGRLGVREGFQGQGLGGYTLNLLKYFFTNNNRTGCRFLIVDAYNKQKVLKFYEKNDFFHYHEKDKDKATRIMYYDLLRPLKK